jgi:hypothetical protein
MIIQIIYFRTEEVVLITPMNLVKYFYKINYCKRKNILTSFWEPKVYLTYKRIFGSDFRVTPFETQVILMIKIGY